ncbi:DUF3142 domain-containing protein [Pseudomonas chlororaphis]|uniref:DUF3142 domain-containing protein n=1 Tax=Pseudomonas chlororaphis TaxID=587753 RepID=UPI00209AD870|nr:DUF3142 domain-containing protein [Pseudomonas chlororaphis]MCO7572407.1 DUF3142 domain-containing protein [Pseudomonas chlororaphis]MCO7590516.1 DUF3142 domain-containing protein [Pseudomonas chlororaphis]
MLPRVLLRLFALLLCPVLLSACRHEDAPPLDQQLYIWQRQWTPAHAEALAGSRADFSTARVLALQAFPQAGWSRARIDAELLKQDGRPLIAVVRLDGQLPSLNQDEILQQVRQLLADWQGQGLTLAGIEIDHDAGSARLPAYAALLQRLREVLPQHLALSITALPAWLDSRELPGLLAQVDSSVLQVHAVSDPQRGLFDPRQAEQWARRWAKISDKPFYLALPAYGVALLSSATGAPVVESEAPIARAGERRELMADPEQLRQLAMTLRHDPPTHLAGLIWFRLPLKGDVRAWSLDTLRAVARGDVLDSRLGISLQEQDGLFDIYLSNPGNLDRPLPEQLTLAVAQCAGFDGLGGYSAEWRDGQLLLTRQQAGRLAAGGTRAVGWARCTKIDQGAAHVRP